MEFRQSVFDSAFDSLKRGLLVSLQAAPETHAKRMREASDRFIQETDPERLHVCMLESIRIHLEGLRASRVRNTPECREAKRVLELMKRFYEVSIEMNAFRPTPYPNN